MTSSISGSSLLRISVASESTATTVSNVSPNSLASLTTSPSTSGSPSPLSPEIAPTRTFKAEMAQKKLLLAAHSVFTHEKALESEKYFEFQKEVQCVKGTPYVEKKESRREDPAKTFNSPLSLRQTAFVQMGEKPYFQKFPFKAQAVDPMKSGNMGFAKLPLFNAHVNQSAASEWNCPVTAFEMGDSLAVFCLSKKQVVVHHFSSATNTIKGVFDRFAKFPREPKERHRIYLVGGDGSPESVQLFDNIQSAIMIYFGPHGKIVESFINPNKDSHFPYVSVACTTKKKLFFCQHD